MSVDTVRGGAIEMIVLLVLMLAAGYKFGYHRGQAAQDKAWCAALARQLTQRGIEANGICESK